MRMTTPQRLAQTDVMERIMIAMFSKSIRNLYLKCVAVETVRATNQTPHFKAMQKQTDASLSISKVFFSKHLVITK